MTDNNEVFSLKKLVFFINRFCMGYVFDFNDAVAYEKWFFDSRNRFAVDLETRIMLDMLNPLKGESILEIGCGTGAMLTPFLEMGLQVTGLDPSPYMLDIASHQLGNRVDLHRGFAENLPFEDNSFSYACFVTTLEFVDDPVKSIEEAGRVAKNKIFLGVLNRYSIKGFQRRIKGVFSRSIYNQARFFSIWELKGIVRSLFADVPVSWKTTCQVSTSPGKYVGKIEQTPLVQKSPFGTFIGMAITLVPRFKTKPLTVPYKTKHSTGPVPG